MLIYFEIIVISSKFTIILMLIMKKIFIVSLIFLLLSCNKDDDYDYKNKSTTLFATWQTYKTREAMYHENWEDVSWHDFNSSSSITYYQNGTTLYPNITFTYNFQDSTLVHTNYNNQEFPTTFFNIIKITPEDLILQRSYFDSRFQLWYKRVD